jgi:membrane protease YdiL (CAAX protease family)
MRQMVEGLQVALGPVGPVEAILLALLSGVAEELLFRGALWHHLGFAGTTLLFGLVHVLPSRKLWLYPVFAIAAGALLGLLRDGQGNVLPPMLAHVLVNAANLMWLGGRARQTAAPAPPAGAAPSPPG